MHRAPLLRVRLHRQTLRGDACACFRCAGPHLTRTPRDGRRGGRQDTGLLGSALHLLWTPAGPSVSLLAQSRGEASVWRPRALSGSRLARDGRCPRQSSENPASSVQGPGEPADPLRPPPQPSLLSLKGHVTRMMPGAATLQNVLFLKRDGVQDGRKTKPTAQNRLVGFSLLLASRGRGAPGHPPSEGQHCGSRPLVQDSAAPAAASCVQDRRLCPQPLHAGSGAGPAGGAVLPSCVLSSFLLP